MGFKVDLGVIGLLDTFQNLTILKKFEVTE
jgi:hypothetical protein